MDLILETFVRCGAVRFVAGEALTFSESNLQIHKPNLVTEPINARNLLTASRRYMLLNIDFYINQDNGFYTPYAPTQRGYLTCMCAKHCRTALFSVVDRSG